MKRWETEAIRLKYLGKTHREIADEIAKLTKVNVTEGNIRNCFNVDGRLYIPYLEYSAAQNKWSEEDFRNKYKSLSTHTYEIKLSIMKQALKKGDYRLAWDVAKDIDDRAGNVVVRKAEVNLENKSKEPVTYEQYLEECRRQGINPRSGLRLSKPQVDAD